MTRSSSSGSGTSCASRRTLSARFEAGPDGMELIAVGNDRPEGGDGEMVQDFWARLTADAGAA